MRLLVSVMLAVGVRVAVQVMPPSALLKPLNTPLATVKSAVVSPVTASLKVMVTSEVSPAARAVSATTMLAVGSTASTRTPLVLPTPLRVVTALLPTASRRVAPLAWMALPTLMPLLSSWPLATVRRNTRALVPEPLRYSANTVPPPSRVMAMRGVPPLVSTFTASLRLTVKSRFCPAT
ncbi:hypothetical protein D3C78_312060 [compost metagenome]